MKKYLFLTIMIFFGFVQSQEVNDSLTSIGTIQDYLSLVHNQGNIGHIKYTVELEQENAASYFQNTVKYNYHIHYLKEQIEKYKELTFNDYVKLIYQPLGKGISFAVGNLYYIDKWTIPAFSKPGFVGFSLYFKETLSFEKVIKTHKALSRDIPLAEKKLAVVFEDPKDFFRYRNKLNAIKIPSIPLNLIARRGNIVRSNEIEIETIERVLPRRGVIIDPGFKIPPIKCEDDEEYFPYSLTESENPFPSNSIAKSIRFSSPNVTYSLEKLDNAKTRLDLCVNMVTGNPIMRRLVSISGWMGAIPNIYTPEKARIWEVKGLDEALAGDISQLFVFVTDENREGHAVQGIKHNESEFLVAGRVIKTNQGWKFSHFNLLVGDLNQGDSFADSPCPLGKNPMTANFPLGTAKFKIDMCIYLGGGETTGYDIYRISVKDSSEKLAPENKDRLVILEKEDLKKAIENGDFIYKWGHHNACDSFYLNVKDIGARYALTTGPMAGCWSPVPNAPKRKHNEDIEITLYRVDYGSGFSENLTARYRHWMTVNP